MPNSPSPSTVKPITDSPENVTLSAVGRPSNIADCVVCNFASVVTNMPDHPAEAERIAPARKQTVILTPSTTSLLSYTVPRTKRRIVKTITNAERYLYSVTRNNFAPIWIELLRVFILSLPRGAFLSLIRRKIIIKKLVTLAVRSRDTVSISCTLQNPVSYFWEKLGLMTKLARLTPCRNLVRTHL